MNELVVQGWKPVDLHLFASAMWICFFQVSPCCDGFLRNNFGKSNSVKLYLMIIVLHILALFTCGVE